MGALWDAQMFLGPCFVLFCIGFTMYGLFCAQVFYYWTTYKDHIAVRLVVVGVSVLESALVAVSMNYLYRDLIINFANPTAVQNIPWSIPAASFYTLAISVLVQSYYVWRIWRVSECIRATIMMITCMFVRLALAVRTSANLCMFKTWNELLTSASAGRYATASFSLNIFVDASIAVMLTIYLTAKSRSQACKRSTRYILLQLTYHAITAGALTVLTSVAVLITFNLSDESITFAGLNGIISMLYANSMLGMLNARRSIARGAGDKHSVEIPPVHGHNTVIDRPITAIEIFRETITTSDEWQPRMVEEEKDDTFDCESRDVSVKFETV